MSDVREEGVYRRIGHLTAIQMASLAVVVLAVAVVAILQSSELRRVGWRMDNIERRIAALETGPALPGVRPPDIAPPASAETRRSDRTKPDDLGAQLSWADLSHRVMSLVVDIADGPTASELDAVTAVLEEIEARGLGTSDVETDLRAGVAKLYLAAERFEKAVEWAKAAPDERAGRMATACTLAEAYYHLGRYEPGLRAVEQCVSASGAEPAATLLRGRLELALGHSDDGEATLFEALAFDSVAADAAVVLTRRLLDRGDVDRAGQVFARAEALAPYRNDVARCRVAVLLARGQYAECIEAASILLALDEHDVPMLRMLGEAWLGAEQVEAAAEQFRLLVRLVPNDARAYDLLGQALLAQLEAADAAEQFARATQLAPGNASAWYHLGVAQANGDDVTAALEALDQALALDGRHAYAHFARAVCLARGGDLTEARQALQRALALDPALSEQAQQVETFREILGAEMGLPPNRHGQLRCPRALEDKLPAAGVGPYSMRQALTPLADRPALTLRRC